MTNIRAMTERDYAQVIRINATCGPAVARLNGEELRRLGAIDNEHLVAIGENSEIVGYALVFGREAAYDGEEFLALRSAISQPFLYIDQVAIAPEARRKGIGLEIHAAIEAIAARHSIRCLCCEVNINPPNPVSLDFHTKIGFESVRQLDASDGRTVVLLAKAQDG